MGGVVRIVLPADRNTHRVETGCFDDGEIHVADGVAPGCIVTAVGIPGVAQVDAAPENRVHVPAASVVYRNS